MDDNIEFNGSGLLNVAASSTGADPSNDDASLNDVDQSNVDNSSEDDVSSHDADQSNGDNPSEDDASSHEADQLNGDEPSLYSDYPKSLEEAIKRYEKNKGKDCFPKIAPALLNSADIQAYIKNTGMIYPFHYDDLQTASYKVRIAGKVVYWRYKEEDDNLKKKICEKISEIKNNEKDQEVVVRREHRNKDKKIKKEIEKIETELSEPNDFFYLQPNSIAFVTLEPEFHIPQYLALRFNLRIKHVYKGLLLGTGPLVDPGFEGRLSIPLHNLTNNTYRFDYGDELISIEFTKLSPNSHWLPYEYKTGNTEEFKFEEFTGDRKDRDVNAYLKLALNGARSRYVISSIPDAIYDSKEQARKASKNVEKIKKHSTVITVGSIIGVFALVITSVTLTFTTIQKVIDKYDELSRIHQEDLREINLLKQSNEENLKKINDLNNKIDELIEQINESKADKQSEDKGEEN